MDEPVDTVGPWTIKAVPTEIRNKVTTAARKEGLTVGQWLERRINEWLEDGGPVHVANNLPVPAAGNRPALPPSPPPDIRALTGAAATLKELDALEPATVAELNRTVRRLSKGAKP